MESPSKESESIDMLTSIFPSHSKSDIIKYFNASNKNLERTTLALLSGNEASIVTESSKNKGKNKRKPEAEGLGNWLGISKKKLTKSTISCKPVEPTTPIKSAFSVLRSEPIASTSTLPSTPSLPPLILGTDDLIELHTMGLCTLIPNVLSKSLASRLFLRMVKDSIGEVSEDGSGKRIGGWEKNRWYLFDREVSSPHTTAFYVEGEGKGKGVTSAYDQKAFAEAAQYWYNGEKRSASTFNSEMDEAREVIGPIVRKLLAGRKRHSLEYEGDWVPNVSAANCYRGSKESVGWHADVLSYLGPYPTIASLSLGVSRPFRLRLSAPSGTPNRTLEIQLPHNSLLIMHAGVQELFKHTIPEVKAVDIFRIWSGLELGISKEEEEAMKEKRWTERINMTFRFYRPDFAPLPSTDITSSSPSTSSSQIISPPSNYVGTPMCACKVPTQLRADAKHKVADRNKSSSSAGTSNRKGSEEREEEEMLFFWTCNGGAQNQGKGCGYFELLNMEREGRGKWWKGVIS